MWRAEYTFRESNDSRPGNGLRDAFIFAMSARDIDTPILSILGLQAGDFHLPENLDMEAQSQSGSRMTYCHGYFVLCRDGDRYSAVPSVDGCAASNYGIVTVTSFEGALSVPAASRLVT